jgi:hypothetical protein
MDKSKRDHADMHRMEKSITDPTVHAYLLNNSDMHRIWKNQSLDGTSTHICIASD